MDGNADRAWQDDFARTLQRPSATDVSTYFSECEQLAEVFIEPKRERVGVSAALAERIDSYNGRIAGRRQALAPARHDRMHTECSSGR